MVPKHHLRTPVHRRLRGLADRLGSLPAAMAEAVPVPYLILTTVLALTGWLCEAFATPAGRVISGCRAERGRAPPSAPPLHRRIA